MRIAITGSSGMLGTALVKELKSSNELLEIDIKAGIDITDANRIREVITDFKPGLIIHAAAMTDVDGCELDPDKAKAVNIQGTKNIVDATGQTKLIYISTDYVFDGKQDLKRPYKETGVPAKPVSVYGQTKLEAERYIQNNLDDYLIIRTSWLFGPGGKNFILSILNLAKKQKELKVVNDQFGIPTYTPDLAKAIAGIINNPVTATKILHLTNSDFTSWYGFAQEIVNISELENEIKSISTEELKRPAARPKNSRLESVYAKPMRSWKEALREYLKEINQ